MEPLPKKRPSTAHSAAGAGEISARDALHARTPLLDVRAPAEFTKGAAPNSANQPILDDAERRAVGIAYKRDGSAAAQALGHELVNGAVKRQRIEQWLGYLSAHPDAAVMCWRGGLRSQIAQSWLAEAGYEVPRVAGGYKALRNACLDIIEQTAGADQPWWVVAGRTGTQKTVLIRQLTNSIDLEQLAHHRGSAFGAHATPQPAPATFENALADAALHHRGAALVLEDESRTIGRLALPAAWHTRMQQAPLVLIEAALELRVEHIVAEYVTAAFADGTPAAALEARYRDALSRISRRLGGVLYQRIDALLLDAFAGRGNHTAWVGTLLQDYYDPMYDYQLRNKMTRVQFRGSISEVADFLNQRTL